MIDTQYGIAIMGEREVSRPYRVCFSSKASGFYPFDDATALAGEAKGCFFMFLFQFPSIFPLNHFLTDAPAAQI